jgi:hypothetical protein
MPIVFDPRAAGSGGKGFESGAIRFLGRVLEVAIGQELIGNFCCVRVLFT